MASPIPVRHLSFLSQGDRLDAVCSTDVPRDAPVTIPNLPSKRCIVDPMSANHHHDIEPSQAQSIASDHSVQLSVSWTLCFVANPNVEVVLN